MFLLGIIPARGGSKGIKSKNIALLNGKPLISYTINAALKCKKINHLLVSTDSPEIASLVEKHNIKCPNLRPPNLATDESPSIDFIKYELIQFENLSDQVVDAVILLQPTTPLRADLDISNSINIFEKSEQQSLISVINCDSAHPYVMYQAKGMHLTSYVEGVTPMRRQDFPPLYMRNGAIYIATRDLIMKSNRLVCDSPAYYIMPRERSINIDEPFDLALADFLIKYYEKQT